MSQKTKERIHLIYGISLSVLIVAVGVCFALSCLSIYQNGNSPFTRESISTHFDRIALPTYICIAGVIGGIILSLVLPPDGGKVKPRREAGVVLEKLSAKLDITACEESVREIIHRERKFRRYATVTVGILSALTLLPALIRCVNPTHFSIENLNNDIKTAAAYVIPCAVVALGMWVATVLLCGASVARETATVKSALATGKGKTLEKTAADKEKKTLDPRFLWAVRGVILVAGIVFVVLGVFNGGMADVLGKAIRICTECIGLG